MRLKSPATIEDGSRCRQRHRVSDVTLRIQRGEGAHEGHSSWADDGPPAGGAVAVDDFDAGVSLVDGVINGLFDFSSGPVPVFS